MDGTGGAEVGLEPATDPGGQPAHTGWSDSSARAVLQLMVESVAEMVGFEVAALSVVLDGRLVVVAYTGPEEFRDAVYSGIDPVSILDPVLELGERWGRFRFLAADRYDGDLDGHWFVVAERSEVDAPDAWDPMDVLMAVLDDDDGRLVGCLSLDRPLSGRRPGLRLRDLLEKYAAQTERAVLTAFEREAMVQQIAHAEAARRLIRAASMPAQSSLEGVLNATHRPLLEGFGATGSWIELLEPRGPGRGHARTRDGHLVAIDARLHVLAGELARQMWRDQRAMVITDDASAPTGPADAEFLDAARHELKALGLTSALAFPLGAGEECLGFLALTRAVGQPPWSSVEMASALEIGYDLGAALVTARALEGERTLVRELQQLDDYRSQLIATLSHELRTPLTVISGNLELLGELEPDDVAARVRLHQAMSRGAGRMRKVVDDLLLLARVSDPRHPLVAVPVDLARTASEVVGLVESTARAKGLTLRCRAQPGGLVVAGDPTELDRVLANLVSNAVKYTPAGGSVAVEVSGGELDVTVRVVDDGIGISPDDQVGLFRAFFRTTNPDALRQPGTGLGLAIVATVVERHGGTVTVMSTLGEGTTFAVTLPRAVPAS